MKRRAVTILLTLAMLFSMLPTTSFAANEGDDIQNALTDVISEVDGMPISQSDNLSGDDEQEGSNSSTEDESNEASVDNAEIPTDKSEDGLVNNDSHSSADAISAEENDELDESSVDEINWHIDNGTLYVDGTGVIPDFEWTTEEVNGEIVEILTSPWFAQREEINSIILGEGITGIGEYAFSGLWNVSQQSDFQVLGTIYSKNVADSAFDGLQIVNPYSRTAYDSTSSDVPVPPADATGSIRYAVLVLDVSGSMSSKPMAAQKAAAIKFCESMIAASGYNYIAIVTFGSSVTTRQQFTNDLEQLKTSINSISAYGGTNTNAAIVRADELLSAVPDSVKASKSIILCSDGLPNTGSTSTDGPFTSADNSYDYRYANAAYNTVSALWSKYDVITLGFFHSLSGSTLEFARKFMKSLYNVAYYEVTDPDKLEFTFQDIADDVTGSGISIISIDKDKYVIIVKDERGRAISGASVMFDGDVVLTGNDGCATFNRFTVGTPVIKVTKDGYIEWTNEGTNWSKSDHHYDTVILYDEAQGKYKLKECQYSNSAGGTGVDILTRVKIISIGNDASLTGDLDFGNFYLNCEAIDTTEIDHYELWQSAKKIAESADGDFGKLSSDDFSEGSDCFIRVVVNDGTAVDTSINLTFKKESVQEATEFKLDAGSVSFAVADDIPYLGGSSIDFEFPISCPITCSTTQDGKLQFGFNLDVATWENGKGELGGQSLEDQIKDFKKLNRYARRAGSLPVGKLSEKDQKIFNSLVKSSNKFKFFKDGEVNFIAYAECDLGNTTATGMAMLQAKIKAFDASYTTWVVFVPVTVQFSFGLEGDLIGEISYDWASSTLMGNVDLKGIASLDAFGGVGIGMLVGVGVYGSAELEALIRLLSLQNDAGLRSVDLTGELGIKAYLAWMEGHKAFAYNTWHLYAAKGLQSKSVYSDAVPFSIYDVNNYQDHDLSYLSEESDWLGIRASTFSNSSREQITSTELTSILTDTYRNAQPVMVAGNDGLYAAFLRADQDTKNVYAAVTKYDGANWLEPVKVDSESILDSAPSLCVGEDGTIWMAYAKTKPSVDKTSLLSFAQNQSIVIGKIDPNTLAFTAVKTFDGAGYAHLQKLALVNNMPTLVWADSTVSSDDSVLWPASSVIYQATYTGGSWSEAQSVATVNKPVLELVAGTGVAYIADEDGDYKTEEDQNLYVGTSKVADNVHGNITFGTLPGSGADFMWNESGTLKTVNGQTVDVPGITEEYAVVGNRIYYSVPDTAESGAHLAAVIYSNGTWGGSVNLSSEGERYLENISVASLNGNDYVFGMNTKATISSDDVDDAKNLVWKKITSTYDLHLESLDYETDNLVAGDMVPVTLYVTNAGTEPVQSIDIAWNDQSTSISCNLQPGESNEIVVNVTCPSVLTQYNFTVSIPNEYDTTPDDNKDEIGIGYADLAVKVEGQKIGEKKAVMAIVTNEGVSSASGTIKFQDSQGNVIDEVKTIDTLVPGAVDIFQCPIEDDGLYTVTITCDDPDNDLYTYNNEDTYLEGLTFSPQLYEVYFDANGGTLTGVSSMQTEMDGKLVSLPDNPTRSGYTFQGWYTAASGGTQVTTSYVFSEDTTVYAQWAPNDSYTITFNANGGACSTTSLITGTDGKLSSLPAATRSNYTFNGWYTAASGGTQVTTSYVFSEDTTVYAQWTYSEGSRDSSSSDSGSSRSSGYAVSVSPATGGKVTASPANAIRGSKVTLTVTPNDDYKLSSLTVTDKNGNELELTEVSDIKYTFTMPSSKVTVRPAFVVKIEDSTPDNTTPTVTNPFVDVSEGSYYYDAVLWAVEQGITTGTTATTFSPDMSCTRAQMVTFLWRAAGSPEPTTSVNPFTDVTSGTYYYDAVLWAVEKGITVGTSETMFSPDKTVNRGQTVTFLYRYESSPAVSAGSSFTDIPANEYYADAVKWAVDNGITNGTGDNLFTPNNDCTRAQIVTFLYRDLME